MAQSYKSGKQRSVDAGRYAMVPRNDVPRSAFDTSHTHKTTLDAGLLVPIYVDEVLPGDSVRLRMTAFARLSTPIVPIMDNLILESFFFFVPNRLVWDRWEQFMGEQATPADSTVFLVPQVTINSAVVAERASILPGGLADYFGITMFDQVDGTVSVNALPFRMYNLIWNDFFRDEDLQDPIIIPTGDGPDNVDTDAYLVRRRGKRHDYFTSARPWPQKPINADEIQGGSGGTPFIPGQGMLLPQSGAPVTGLGVPSASAPVAGVALDYTGGRVVTPATMYGSADLRAADADGFPDVRVLINDIRTANVVQLLMERNARGGTRYAEIVRSHFGVISPDARLQRPEYLGGGRTQVTINPVAQTSATGQTGSTTVLGELAGVGTAVAVGHGFSQSFTEHGFILGLVQVRADLTYQQGINRMWFRRTQFDFYWPALANLGEQSVLSREIFYHGDATQATGDVSVFGYQERWSEYKHKPNRISGLFRSTATGTLDFWHLSQVLGAGAGLRPLLDDEFIQDNPPVARILAVDPGASLAEQFLFDSVIDVRQVRCMPMFSIPGLGPRL